MQCDNCELTITRLFLLLCFYTWLLCCGAEVRPTTPPTQYRASPTPEPTRGSSSEAPATLTCWSDPDPESTGDAPQGGVIANMCHSQMHACHQYLTAVGQPSVDGWWQIDITQTLKMVSC